MPSSDRVTTGPTFAEMLVQTELLDDAAKGTRVVIERAVISVDSFARKHLKVVSCHTCTEPKGCCKLKTAVYLHEAVVLVARLKREGRDTPELRQQLKEAAHYMETVPKLEHRRPCVFLNADERCTVYDDRPSVCGMAPMSSPASQCNVPDGDVVRIDSEEAKGLPPKFEFEFVMRAGLRRLERRYIGALPRMVLIALEAWDRRDYVKFLAERCLPASHRFQKIMG